MFSLSRLNKYLEAKRDAFVLTPHLILDGTGSLRLQKCRKFGKLR
jgi:hypothetical protein